MNVGQKMAASCLLALAAAAPSWGQTVAGEPQTYMKKVGFSAAEIATMESGKPVTRIVPEEDDNDASVVGVIRIKAPEEAFVSDIRKIESFRAGSPTLQVGRFSPTPAVSDLQSLVIDDSELEALRRCKVGECDVQVGAAAMELARKVDWKAGDAHAQATRLVKEAMVRLVQKYLQEGSAGMAVYDDNDVPESVAAEWEKILRNSPNLMHYDPELWKYLLEFPKPTLPGVESFVYWSKDKIRKPVVSIVHVCIQKIENDGGADHFIAMKHIYDSHYFLAAAEFLALVPDRDAETGFFLVQNMRARLDPPRKLRGLLLGKIKSAMRDDLGERLAGWKTRLERETNERPGQR